MVPYAAPAPDAPTPDAPAPELPPRTLPALVELDRTSLGGTLRGVFGAWRPPAATAAPTHDPERELARALDLTAAGRLDSAVAHAEAATAPPATDDQRLRALALLEDLYAKLGDSDAVTEVIGRQIVATPAAGARAQHWRRRAALYRDVLHREAETYRCLREAHACAPDDADIAYELRAVAMARGEWALTAELLYREIAAASSPRDKGALHLELGMVYDEKLLDPDQARRNYEQALAHDPSIPAARRPLAHLYELAGRHGDAARWYERAADVARPAERAHLLERAALATARAGLRGAASAIPPPTSPTPLVDDDAVGDLSRRLAAAAALGDTATALAIARDINARDARHPAAFRVLDEHAQQAGDLDGLTALYARRADADPGERAHLYYALARITEDAGALEIAAGHYDRALAASPEQPGALDARAGIAMKLGDWVTADALYARLAPAHATLSAEALLLRRAELAELLGRDADALARARAAAALQPPRKDAWAQVARLAEKVGDLATALAAARAQLELLPPGDTAAVTAVRATAAALSQRARRSGRRDRLAGADPRRRSPPRRGARRAGRALRGRRQPGRRRPRPARAPRRRRHHRQEGGAAPTDRRAGPRPGRAPRRRRRVPARLRSRSGPRADPAPSPRRVLARRRPRRAGRGGDRARARRRAHRAGHARGLPGPRRDRHRRLGRAAAGRHDRLAPRPRRAGRARRRPDRAGRPPGRCAPGGSTPP